MRSLHTLVWRNLTAHALRSILTLLAIALGVAMVLAASIVGQAAGRSVSRLSEEGPRVDAASLIEIFSRDGAPFDAAVLDTLYTSPDVEWVSPSLHVEAELVLSAVEGGVAPEIAELTLLGVHPEPYAALHEPELTGGAFLDGPDTILIKCELCSRGSRSGSIVLPVMVAIENGLSVGDEVTLAVEGRTVTLKVSGRLRLAQDLEALSEETVAYVPLDVAQALAGVPGEIDHVAVTLRPGADPDRVKADLAARLDGELAIAQVVDTGGGTFATIAVQIGLAMVGIIMLFAAAFVIMNAFAMSITARTREIGALRALGMTRGCKRSGVMLMVLAEAGLLGLTGASLGVPVGIGLAWGVMWARGTLNDASFVVPWWGVGGSVILGSAVTLIGALQPAWRASRVSPLMALRAAGKKATPGWYERYGGRVGGVLLLVLLPGVTAAAFVLEPDFFTAFAFLGIGMVGLLLGTALLTPALIRPTVQLVRPLLVRWQGAVGRLAADNLTRNKLRTALTAGALTIGLTAIIATSALLTFSLKGGLNAFFGLFHEDGMIIPDIPALLTSGEITIENSMDVARFKLDPALVEAIDERDVGTLVYYGFASVQTELSTFPGAPATFVDPEVFLPLGNFDFFEGDEDSALEMMRRGRALLLMPITAERLGAGVGDAVPVQTPHGEVEFTVAGIGGTSTNFTVFSYADGETYFDLSGPSWLGLVTGEGQDVDQVLAQLETAIEPFEDVVIFDMRDAGVGGLIEIIDQLQVMLNTLLLLAVIVAGVGVVNTVVINVSERRREIALLRAVGATQRQVRQVVMIEAATLGLMASLVATALGLTLLTLLALVFLPNSAASVGLRVSWETVGASVPPALRDLAIAAVLSLVFGPLVAALAAYYPARRAAAMDVVEATRSERLTLKRTKVRRTSQVRCTWPISLTWTMAWRNLAQSRLRTTLTALAVALGVAMTVAADVISAALLNSLSGSEDAQKFMTGLLEQLGAALQMVGVGITLAAGFLIFNAFAMAVTQRRRQIGSLRALGMTRRQVLRLVLVESLVVGGLGTVLGLVAGPLLGRTTIALMKIILGGDVFVFSASNPSLNSMLLATALGLSIALLSALIPAWQAGRVSPLTALREETRFLRKAGFLRCALVGAAMLLTLTIYLAVAPPGEWVEYPWDQRLAAACVAIWMVGWGLIAPGLIGGLGRWTRGALAARWGAVGRLMADNLRRGRGRVTLTILTLVVGLTMIIGMTGFMHLTGDELLIPTLVGFERLRALIVSPFDVSKGMAAYADLERIALPPELVAELPQAVGDRARVMDEWRFVIVPELSFFSSSYFSLVADPHDVQFSGDVFFDFIEGDWETAMPLLEEGCGVLAPPMIASQNGVSVGQTFEVTGKDGPVRCTLAGIGRTFVNTSIIGLAAKDEFSVTEPFLIYAVPLPGTDRERLKADLEALLARYPGVHLMEPESMYAAQVKVVEVMPDMFNALLLLAILAAALGVVNTTMMSVAERRRELGLLRAVGATRRQVMRVLTGEAALMGAIGGGLGLVVGVGVVAIIVVTYGGNSWGVPDLDLWGAAWRSVQPALVTGLVGLLVAPIISAGAAWLPTRSLLRGSAIETLEAERQQAVSPRRTAAAIWRWGSIRARFALGTAALMAVVLAGLVAVVTTHARVRIEEQTHDALRTMVAWNAGMIELGLPEDAETLDFDSLMAGGGAFDFDADMLLRFESLMDDVTKNGLVDFTIADRDSVVLVSLDMHDVGTLTPELETSDEAAVSSERGASSPLAGETERRWLMHASAPVRNARGTLVGSVRMTVDARQVQDFLGGLRNRLAAIGAVIALVGVSISWWLATPLVRTIRQLTAHAAGGARGEYVLFTSPHTRAHKLYVRLSLRTKLTIALVLILILMVGTLELVAIPIERRRLEDTLTDGMLAAAEWIGQAASESLDVELLPADMEARPTFGELVEMVEMGAALDLARLQELTEQMRSDDAAYVALVDEEGTVVLSDQLALIGEEAPVPSAAQVEETTWRGEEMWVASTPLRRGQDGELIGALRMGVRRDCVEAFLDESRNLFRLAGLIAVLAGILLAQAIGGAVTAPVRQLATCARHVGEGDLTVRFDAGTKDELAILASAYNQMVMGLQERGLGQGAAKLPFDEEGAAELPFDEEGAAELPFDEGEGTSAGMGGGE
jgi:putative ABC transport system permease protein